MSIFHFNDEQSPNSSSTNHPLHIFRVLYCPAMFGHFGPAPVKTDRAVRIQ